jgi:hypothetical protein
MDTRTASDTRSGDRLGWVLGLTSTAYFMVVLDSLVVVSALPHMLPTMPAAVLDAVAPQEMGKASGMPSVPLVVAIRHRQPDVRRYGLASAAK